MAMYPIIRCDNALHGDCEYNDASFDTWCCDQSDVAFVFHFSADIVKYEAISIPTMPKKVESDTREFKLTIDDFIIPLAT